MSHLRPVVRDAVFPPIREALLLAVLGFLVASIYHQLDPREMLIYEIFPWDSRSYYRVAAEFRDWPPSLPLTELYPYGPRLVWPLLIAAASTVLSTSLSTAAFLVGTVVAILVGIATYFVWIKNGVGKRTAFFAVLLFFVASSGPLRSSGVYPGGGIAVEMATMLLSYWAVSQCSLTSSKKFPMAIIAVFIASTSREFVVVVLLTALALSWFARTFLRKHLRLGGLGSQILNDLNGFSRTRLYALVATATIGTFAARQLVVEEENGSYSVWQTIFQYGYFRLNFLEFLYPYMVAFGPLFLILVVSVLNPLVRSQMKESLRSKVPNAGAHVVMLVVTMLFALVGGSDSERFLSWGLPFFSLFALHGLQTIWQVIGLKNLLSVTFLMAALFWSRFYVPASPHIFFPGEKYCSWAGVKTNYDPNLYRGVPGLHLLRQPLKEVPSRALISPEEISLNRSWSEALPQVPIEQVENPCGENSTIPLRGAYLFNANHLPIPLGFPHNQYESLAAHSFHGSFKVRLIIVAQWVMLVTVSAIQLRIRLIRASSVR